MARATRIVVRDNDNSIMVILVRLTYFFNITRIWKGECCIISKCKYPGNKYDKHKFVFAIFSPTLEDCVVIFSNDLVEAIIRSEVLFLCKHLATPWVAIVRNVDIPVLKLYWHVRHVYTIQFCHDFAGFLWHSVIISREKWLFRPENGLLWVPMAQNFDFSVPKL